MSKKIKKDPKDLIEDITVEELRSDGLVEDVEVQGEAPKKKDEDAKADNTPTGTPAGSGEVKAAIAAAPVAMAPHSQGNPEAPELAPEVAKAQSAIDAAIKAAPTAEPPKTKAGLINAMYSHLQSMKTEDLANVYQTLTTPTDVPKADEPAPDADADKVPADADKAVEPKADADEKDAEKKDDDEESKKEDETDEKKVEDSSEEDESKKEDDEEEEEDESKKKVDEQVDALMASDATLSEDFRSKAAALVEQRVEEKVKAEVLRLEESYQERLIEGVAKATEGLTEKVNSYLAYVVSTWMEENKVAIESGLRTEIAENFMKGLQGLFKESYVEVPEGKENLVDSLNTEVAKLEEQLLKATESNMKLNESVNALTRQQVIAEASSDLTSTEAVKLNSLVESVDFDDAATFQKKVATIKESFLRKNVIPSQDITVETATNEAGQEVELSPLMEAISSTISRLKKQA
jgi:hypothetical protein